MKIDKDLQGILRRGKKLLTRQSPEPLVYPNSQQSVSIFLVCMAVAAIVIILAIALNK